MNAGEYITFTATTSGAYYIHAAGYQTSTGNYELTIQPAADLTFNDLDATGAYAWSDLSGNSILQSFINIHDGWDSGDLTLNRYKLQTYLHEIGHALGLGHAGPYNGSATWGTNNLYDNDSWSASVMSYFRQLDNPFDPSSRAYLATIMPADLIAIQNLYGAGTAGYQTGNTVWGPGGNLVGAEYFQDFLDMWGGVDPANPLIYAGNDFAFMVYDTGGIDTLNFSVFSQNQTINLNPLVRSNIGGLTGNVVIARGTVIENALAGRAVIRSPAMMPTTPFMAAAATTAAHRILYNQSTGQLFYDADGNGAGAAILFATLSPATELTNSDFLVI